MLSGRVNKRLEAMGSTDQQDKNRVSHDPILTSSSARQDYHQLSNELVSVRQAFQEKAERDGYQPRVLSPKTKM